MIDSFLYLPDYPIGHLIAFQIEEQIEKAGNARRRVRADGEDRQRRAGHLDEAGDRRARRRRRRCSTATEKALATCVARSRSDHDRTIRTTRPSFRRRRPRRDAARRRAPPRSSRSISRPSRTRARSATTTRTTTSSRGSTARCARSLTNLPEGEVPRRYAETVYGMLVADGVGGSAAGEIASRTAIQALVDLVIDTPDWIMRLDEPLARGGPAAHGAPLPEGPRGPRRARRRRTRSCGGMATTLTVACSLGPSLLTRTSATRAPTLFRDGQLMRLTRDQTMAQSLADAGAITPDEVAQAPHAPRADERARDARRLRRRSSCGARASRTATSSCSAPTA